MTAIFKPKKINVGFQERGGTYTGKLAYVVYTDEKGVLRKAQSWNSWRNKNIEPQEFDNDPTEGFVLNKKAGDYSGSWGNHRQAYCRVYDPRGFEFEITINNLLYILENADVMRGKGLIGKFFYAWKGKDLLLVPENSPEYKKIIEYSALRENPDVITAKTLKLGATYANKSGEKFVYLGRFSRWEKEHVYLNPEGEIIPYCKWQDSINAKFGYVYGCSSRAAAAGWKDRYDWVDKGKYYYFCSPDKTFGYPTMAKSIDKGRFIKIVDENPVHNYATLLEGLECSRYYSPYDESKDEYIPLTPREIDKGDANWWYAPDVYISHDLLMKRVCIRRYVHSNAKKIELSDASYSNDAAFNEFLRINSVYETLEELMEHLPLFRLKQYLKNGKEMKS